MVQDAEGLGQGRSMRKGRRFKGGAMNNDYEEFWSALPEKAQHPFRVPIIEALWRIDEPLSAIGLVDVFDGVLSMWDAAHHLHVLDVLDVAEPSPVDRGSCAPRGDLFDVPYRLTNRGSDEGT
jgi:hypothetical protein